MKCRNYIFSAIAGIIIGFCFAAGRRLDVDYNLDLTQADFYLEWLALFLISTVIVHILWLFGKRIVLNKKIEAKCDKISGCWEKIEGRLGVVGIMLLIFALWVPVWLSIFPGVFSYDAYDEWQQIVTGNITSHHPVLHVLFLGGITEGVYQLTGSYNAGIATVTVVQMLILAFVFSYTVLFMKEQKVPPLFRLFALIFYACSPVVSLFAICSTKDTLFSAALLLFGISMYRMIFEGNIFWENKKRTVLFVLSAAFTMILRNNGLYVVLLSLVILGITCKKYIKKYLPVCVIVLALYGLYSGPFCALLGAQAGGKQEMLSVPLQQLARVYHYEQESFTDQDIAYLHALIPQENWEAYKSTVSDYVKSGFCEEVFTDDPVAFFRLWIETGLKNPSTYLNSFLLGTVDFWYPFAVVDGYQAANSSYFDYRVTEPGTENVFVSGLHEVLEWISHDEKAQMVPGMFLILSPGWYLLLFVLLFLYTLKEREYRKTIALLPVLFNFATVLLGPIALVRYVLILFLVFPLYSVFLFRRDSDTK